MNMDWINRHLLMLQRLSVCLVTMILASAVVLLAQYVASDAPANGAAHKATSFASFLVMIWAIAVFWMALTGRLDSKLKKTSLPWRKPELVVDNTK